MSKYKVTGAKLHSNLFISSTQLGPTLETGKGARAVELTVEENFLRVKLLTTGKETIVPMTNVIQIDIDNKPEPTKK